MELQFPSGFLLFTLIPTLLMVVQMVKKTIFAGRRLIPGPWRLPLLGNLHQLGPLTHSYLRDLARKHGPLMHIQIGEVSTLVASSPEIAKEIMHTHDLEFSDRPILFASHVLSYGSIDLVFSQYGDYWRRLRKICMMQLLSTKRIQSFGWIREEEVSNVIKIVSLNMGTPINLSKMIRFVKYGITARAAFSKKSKDQESFISLVMKFVEMGAGFGLLDAYPSIAPIIGVKLRRKVEELHQQLDQILEDIISEHKERSMSTRIGADKADAHEDLVDVLLKLRGTDADFSLPNDSIKAVILDIFTGGSETTAQTANWAMAELLKNPKMMKRAQAEVRQVFGRQGNVHESGIHDLEFLKLVIKETLRLHPPFPLVPRNCRENCTINGYEIPVGTRVTVNLWALGRDTKHWNEPERFWPDRFLDRSIDYNGLDFVYIPFGSGRRICPGISYGLANLQLLLAQLLYHFDWELPGGMKKEDLDMAEKPGAIVGRKEDLILIPIPYRTVHPQYSI